MAEAEEAEAQVKALGTLEITPHEGEVSHLSILSATVEEDILTITYRLDGGGSPHHMWKMEYHTETGNYSPLRANGLSSFVKTPQETGEEGSVAYPAPEDRSATISLYHPDAPPLAGIKVTYE